MSRVFGGSSGVWAASAVIVGSSLRTVAGRGGVRTMARVCRGGAIAIIGSPVRIGIGRSVIGGPIARIAEIFGRPPTLAAAIAVEVRTRRRAEAAGSGTSPAVRAHSKSFFSREAMPGMVSKLPRPGKVWMWLAAPFVIWP